ncbi:IclR family transcriptional regulator [Devosia sp. YIM 151766]|uniref:IclR family transcriptional regulator n=1 Tax=Devosia sp. YIM 151766 TaxID=3017325 RepID=UPI00255CCD8C|nr:IclR family transcriptional regulator [Devosia sp. YIM 151766]WIY52597.1 IclR family transcriptional regulator [Devosia sp. YIM 151766]
MSTLDTNISATALKALSVLDFLGEQQRPLSVIEVATGMGADRATAYRMLMTLVQAGYVTRDESAKSYALSLKVLSLTRNLIREDDRALQIVSCIRQIAEETGETVHYSMLEGDSAVLLFRAKGTQRVSVDFQIGDRSALPSTSIGKVLLAYQDARFTDAVIAKGLPQVAPKTITDPDALRRELALVRAQRYAFDDMEFAPDMRCVAVAVFERGGIVPGGIAISGPSSRFDIAKLKELREVLLSHAKALSDKLGG